MVDVAAEKNSTLVMPFPVKLLRFFDRAATAVARSASADEESPVTGALTLTDPQASTGAVPSTVPEMPDGDPVPQTIGQHRASRGFPPAYDVPVT